MLNWSLLAGAPLMVALVIAGAVCLLALLLRRGTRWWLIGVPVAALLTGISVFLVYGTLTWWWIPWPDPLPPLVWTAITLGVAALWLALARVVATLWRRRSADGFGRSVGNLGLGFVVILACAELANVQFGQYPTVRDALGLPPPDQVSFASVNAHQKHARRPVILRGEPGRPLSAIWHAPRNMPKAGVVSQVDIPGPVSRFPARPGWVYLPPAYLTSPRPRLPVLVLVNGQPGNPVDWLEGGMLATRMNRFAAAHHGLAPVVVIPDDLGSPTTNPMCLNSRLGNAFTYLSRDVPTWIRHHLQVNPDTRTWSFGGFSNGGTCAIQMALNDGRQFPTFIDIAGEDRPSTGSLAKTVTDAFGGTSARDYARFDAVDPLHLLARHTYRGLAGEFVVGSGDSRFRPQTEKMYAAARAAGVRAHLHLEPGGHAWAAWGATFSTILPWLGARIGLIG